MRSPRVIFLDHGCCPGDPFGLNGLAAVPSLRRGGVQWGRGSAGSAIIADPDLCSVWQHNPADPGCDPVDHSPALVEPGLAGRELRREWQCGATLGDTAEQCLLVHGRGDTVARIATMQGEAVLGYLALQPGLDFLAVADVTSGSSVFDTDSDSQLIAASVACRNSVYGW